MVRPDWAGRARRVRRIGCPPGGATSNWTTPRTRKVKKVLDKNPLLGKGYLVFTFIEHPTFTKQIESLFSDEEY